MGDPLDAFMYHGPQPTAPAAADPLDGWLDDQAKAATSASIIQGGNPDQAGRANQLARSFGLAADTAQRNLPDLEALQQARQAQGVIDQHPTVGPWLSDPRNAAVARDDLVNVARNAAGWKALPANGPVLRAAPETAPTFWNSLKGIATNFVESAKQIPIGLERMGADLLPNIGPAKRAGIPQLGDFRAENAARGYQRSVATAQASDPAFSGGLRGRIASKLYGGASTLAQAAPAMLAAAAGGLPAAIAVGAAQAGAPAYSKYRGRGGTAGQAALGATAEAATMGVTEALPLGYLAGNLGKVGMKPFLAGWLGRELPAMEAQSIAQSATDTAIANPEKTWGDFARELPETMTQAAVTSLMSAGLVGAAHYAGTRLAGADGTQVQAADQASALGKIMDAAAESKVRARDPEAFGNLISGLAKGSPVENLYVPAETVAQHFQSLETNYHDDHFWGSYSDQIDHGLATGGDVVLPTSEAATHLAGTPAWDAIKGDVRTSAGGVSLSEAEALGHSHEADMEKLGESLADQFHADREAAAPREKLTDAMREKLSLAGMRPDEAQMNAELVGARYAARAERTGKPLTGTEADGIDVHRVLPEGLAAVATPSAGDAWLRSTINTMRTAPKAEPRGKSLLEWISARGGINDEGGELASMDAGEWHKGKPGKGKLIRRSGAEVKAGRAQGSMLGGDDGAVEHGLDRTFEAARGAGYFPELDRDSQIVGGVDEGTYADAPDHQHLLDAIGDELRGKPRYPQGEEPEPSPSRAAADDLERLLHDAGLDPQKASLKEIQGAVDAYRERAKGDYEQAVYHGSPHVADKAEISTAEGIPIARGEKAAAAFREWFGDSVAANSMGSPITLFHGTDANIEAFDKAKRGSATHDADARFAFFLSDDPDVASQYAAVNGRDGQNVVPAVVSVQNPLTVDMKSADYDTAKFREFIMQAKEQGRDGVVFKNVRDGTLKESDPVSITYAVFEPAQIKSVHNDGTFSPNDPRILHQGADGGARGSISFRDGKSIVQLFEASNLSTFAHEMGHNWLEELRRDAESPDAPDALRSDWQTVKDWFGSNGHGIGDDGVIPTDAHELWARGFERFLMEGKAPSSALRRVFDTFRSWMLHIYKVVANLGAPISPEIREVMGRLIATDDEIAATSERQRVDALFKDAAAAGMSDAEFGAYQKATSDARDAAKDALLYKAMSTIRDARTKAWQDERADVAADVGERVNARPEFQALHLLRTGKMLGDAEGEPIRAKLDTSWLVDHYGEGILKELPKQVPPVYSKDAPIDADSLAEMAGFKSGDEMVRRLLGVEQARREMRDSGDKRSVRQRLIDDETDATMRDRHGDPLHDGSIEEDALASVHNERQGEVIASELRALRRKQRGDGPATPYSLAKDWAARSVAEGKVSEVLSGSAIQRYARAAAKASKAAEDAMLKGDVDETYRQKQSQMLNNALVAEAGRAKDEIDAAVKRLGKLAKAKTLKSMDQDYLDQIHALLEDIDMRPRTAALDRERATFDAWAKAKEDAGEEVVRPPRLDVKDSYRSMSVEQLRGLADTVDSIAHLGRMKKKLLVAKEERDFAEYRDELVAKTDPLPDGKVSQDAAPKPSLVGRIAAEMLQINSMARELDAMDPVGPWSKLLIHDATDAANAKDQLKRDVLDPLATLYNEMSSANRRRIHEKVTVNELPMRHADGSVEPRAWRRADLLLMALHTGTESNLDKMTRGERWSPEAVKAVLDRELNQDDWRFVKKAWRQVDTLWPHIARVERELTGVVPEKVDGRTVETPFGEVQGGYWPVNYDPIRDQRAAALYADDGTSMFGQHGRAVATPKGYTVERTAYAGPIMWSLEGSLFNHLDRVTTRIAYGRYVRDTLKVIRDPKVRETVIRKRGLGDYRALEPWLQGQVNNAKANTSDLMGMTDILKQARINATIVGLGLRITTAVQHIAYLARTAGEIGPVWTGKGIAASLAHMGSNSDFVFSRSAEMMHRAETFDQNVREAFAQMGTRFNGKPIHDARIRTVEFGQKWAFWAMGKILLHTVAMPTWLGAYQKGMHEGMSEEDAARYSDDIVNRTNGGARAKDLTAFQRGDEFARQLGMFYSAFAPIVNRQREMIRGLGRVAKGQALPGDTQRAIRTAFFLLVAEPTLLALVKGQGPQESENWGEWAARKSFFNLWSGIPVVRDASSGVERWTEGKATESNLAQVDIPALHALVAAGQVGIDAAKSANGAPPDNWVQHAVETPGYFFGLPTGQPAATAQFLHDVHTGKDQPKTAGDWWTGVTKGHLKH